MRAILVNSVMLCVVAASAFAQAEPKAAAELKNLEGVWRIVSTGGHGEVVRADRNPGRATIPPGEDTTFESSTFTIAGDRLTTRWEPVVLTKTKPAAQFHFAVRMHPGDYRLKVRTVNKAAPGEIDLIIGKDQDVVLKGIYERDGDQLKLCVVNWMACEVSDDKDAAKVASTKTRPTDFRTKAGGEHVSFVLKRVAAAADPRQSRTPISAENVHRMESVAEFPKRADRIIRGPQNGELILLDWNSSVEVVDDEKFQTLRTIAPTERPTDFAITSDGKRMAWTEKDKETYTVQESSSGKSLQIATGQSPGYVAFSPDGKLLAIGNTYWDPNAEGVGHSETKIYDVSGQLLRTLARTGPGAVKPVFSPDGKTLAVGNRNYETLLFDVATGKLLHTLNKRMTQELAFSPDGKVLAAAYVDGTIALWDVATGKSLHSAPSGNDELYSVDWNLTGDVLATCGRNGKIILWTWQQGKLVPLKVWDAPVWVGQIRFSADGTRVLAASASDYTGKSGRKIEVWAVPNGAPNGR